MSEPSARDADVASIHAAPFDRMTHLARRALRDRAGVGITLLGEPGIGKSHLLARLYRWANEPGPDGSARACFASVHNLMTDPDRLPRYLLKCIVAALTDTRPHPGHLGPLYRLLRESLFAHARRLHLTRLGFDEFDAALEACFRDSPVPIDRPIRRVLIAYYKFASPARLVPSLAERNRFLATSALDWLSGDPIDAHAGDQLGLTQAEPGGPVLSGKDVEAVAIALGLLAARDGKPFLLCVDQVDNLDPDRLAALTQFLHVLIDHARNLTTIFSGVQTNLEGARAAGTIPAAAWDRVAQYTIQLEPIKRDSARHLLESRVEAALEPYATSDGVRTHLREDNLFPVGRQWFDRVFDGALQLSPRGVLTLARDEWDRQAALLDDLGGAEWLAQWPGTAGPCRTDAEPTFSLEEAIDVQVCQKLAESSAERMLNPAGLPADAGNMVGLLAAVLGRCVGKGPPYSLVSVRRMQKAGNRLPAYDLHIEERREGDGARVVTAVACVSNQGQSATASLKRLLHADLGPLDHRVLVTDHDRRPLTVGAVGLALYKDLKALGHDRFYGFKLSFRQYTELDALEAVVGLARSGDLEVEWPPGTIRRVSEAEVVASHHRRDRYRAHPLLRPLLTEDFPADGSGPSLPRQEPGPLSETDLRRHIEGQIAWRLGANARELAVGYLHLLPEPRPGLAAVWDQLKRVVTAMHREGVLHAQPIDEDLFVARSS